MSRYSHSRLSCFKQCPQKFLWRYVWNVRPAGEGIEAFLGKRVHESLEVLYEPVIRGEAPVGLPEVLERFEHRWRRTFSDSIRIVADRDADYYRRAGHACLETYYRKHHPFDAGTTVGVEKEFEFLLEEGSAHRICGFIDRIDIGPDGAIEVHDYKTGRRVASLRTLADDTQVALYEIGARRLFSDRRRVRLVWHYLRAGVERCLPARDPIDLSVFRRRLRGRIDAIEFRIATYRAHLDPSATRELSLDDRATRERVPPRGWAPSDRFPTRVGPLCRWCDYLRWCEDGSRYAGLPFEPQPSLPPPIRELPGSAPGPAQGRLF